MKLTAVLLFAAFLMATVATLRADQLTEEKPTDFTGTLGRKKRAHPNEDQFRAFFRLFDKDKDGYISADEAFEFLQKMDKSISREAFDKVFQRADTSGDGKLNIEELVKIVDQAS